MTRRSANQFSETLKKTEKTTHAHTQARANAVAQVGPSLLVSCNDPTRRECPILGAPCRLGSTECRVAGTIRETPA